MAQQGDDRDQPDSASGQRGWTGQHATGAVGMARVTAMRRLHRTRHRIRSARSSSWVSSGSLPRLPAVAHCLPAVARLSPLPPGPCSPGPPLPGPLSRTLSLISRWLPRPFRNLPADRFTGSATTRHSDPGSAARQAASVGRTRTVYPASAFAADPPRRIPYPACRGGGRSRSRSPRRSSAVSLHVTAMPGSDRWRAAGG